MKGDRPRAVFEDEVPILYTRPSSAANPETTGNSRRTPKEGAFAARETLLKPGQDLARDETRRQTSHKKPNSSYRRKNLFLQTDYTNGPFRQREMLRSARAQQRVDNFE